ncbi:ISAs1 family transposase [Bacteroides sp. 51]|nr:ISAs1 family transposase [Bacteroides sp. 51]NDV84985.1 ISAs1 family transposase [Bacteroides sp. 51]
MPKKTTLAIIESGNHYIIQIKKNQPNLYNQTCVNTSDEQRAISICEETTCKRGRVEYRKVLLYKDISGISEQWVGLKRLIRVERTVTCKGKQRRETAYYITSLATRKAEVVAKHIRNHWGIENRLHWVKDVSMKEDKSKTAKGYAAENISILRNIAINLFRTNGFDSIKHATQFYANNVKELWRIITSNTKYYKKT